MITVVTLYLFHTHTKIILLNFYFFIFNKSLQYKFIMMKKAVFQPKSLFLSCQETLSKNLDGKTAFISPLFFSQD
jgi:hypothetical protein